ncbi:calcium/sodium antiporter [Haliovirga abyssi]|uniref:Sodium:calcium antiporter n=1 Tax=Haliovirga abyssi TaxID=2996794 RepID=A0AAU9DNY8_9FUSO|nr:calcium/sodium antiporter [Haliovirga abyssi]BDU50098.1 sodium:calcium antiporter [Haliovirga abyssi]
MVNIILLVIGFILLIKGADLLVDGSVKISRKLSIPELIIGLTLVSAGTSAPELVVSILASVRGDGGIAISNVLGSNIANISLVMGISLVLATITIGISTLKYEIPFLLVISMSLLAMLRNNSGTITKYDGFVLLGFLTIFVSYLFALSKSNKDMEKQILSELEEIEKNESSWRDIIIFTGIGLVILSIGGELTVSNAVAIAKKLGVSQVLIGATIVALGTSLPELVTSIIAAKKGSADMMVGNIIGSNIFNILTVLGISSLFNNLVPDRAPYFDSIYGISIIILVYILSKLRKSKLGIGTGILLLISYVVYVYIGVKIG